MRASARCGPRVRDRKEACLDDGNLVDPASSHTLVSKIKPCMSKYKHYTVKLRMAHYISFNLLDSSSTWITVVILELIHALKSRLLSGRDAFVRYNQPFGFLVNHNN